MKNLLLLFSTFILSTSAFCVDDIKLGLCNNTESLTLIELNNCSEVTINNNQYTVKSYSISFEVNGINYEVNATGSSIPNQMKQDIQNHNPTKILISKVILTNTTTNIDMKFGSKNFNINP